MDRFKSVIRERVPGVYRSLHRWRQRTTLGAIARKYDDRIAAGPFEGMRYFRESFGSALVPKFVGSYECELHGIFTSLGGRGITEVVDIGCAEGYYAVGLARLLPDAKVVAYDIDPHARDLCRQLCELNSVEGRVSIGCACGPQELKSVSGRRAFVLCDCEGFELDLFDVDTVRDLATADLLVETHDMYRPGCTEELCSRFAATHGIEVIAPRRRLWSDFPAVAVVPRIFRRYALDEWRNPAQRWISARARLA
jgi:SAM-dependent methyltransferase